LKEAETWRREGGREGVPAAVVVGLDAVEEDTLLLLDCEEHRLPCLLVDPAIFLATDFFHLRGERREEGRERGRGGGMRVAVVRVTGAGRQEGGRGEEKEKGRERGCVGREGGRERRREGSRTYLLF